jgi:hypothetical protein
MSKSDPQVDVYMRENKNGNWVKIGQTERITNNLNPDFAKQIETSYYFEKEQFLKFEVWDIDLNSHERDFIGRLETTMGKLMGSAKQTMLADLVCEAGNNRGKIVVRLDCVNTCNDDLVFKLKANLVPKTTMGCCNGSNNPYFIISRARENNGQNSEFIKVY